MPRPSRPKNSAERRAAKRQQLLAKLDRPLSGSVISPPSGTAADTRNSHANSDSPKPADLETRQMLSREIRPFYVRVLAAVRDEKQRSSLHKWLLGSSIAIAIGAYWGGWGLLSMSPPDFAMARLLVSIACVWIGTAGLVWLTTTDELMLVRLVAGVFIACVVCGIWPGTFHYISKRETLTSRLQANQTTTTSTMRPEVSQTQSQTLENLGNFLSKDEGALRQAFDFVPTLQDNLAIQRKRIEMAKAGQILIYANFFIGANGTMICSTALALAHTTEPVPGGPPHINEGEHDVLCIVTTPQYRQSSQILESYIDSALVPQSIKSPLIAYRDTVQNNMTLMVTTFNKYKHADDAAFINYDNGESPYYSIVWTEYFRTFTDLKPEADAVVNSIAKYLGTN